MLTARELDAARQVIAAADGDDPQAWLAALDRLDAVTGDYHTSDAVLAEARRILTSKAAHPATGGTVRTVGTPCGPGWQRDRRRPPSPLGQASPAAGREGRWPFVAATICAVIILVLLAKGGWSA